ncbi:hypothetical protein [Pedobacter chitinilyticus]|uniref:Uncharacterized protein n=1 Tax=Pedobacter chitinilyticus TaxID=2233776 RepID=A0A3S3PPN9_9SPHI|nr:hypothetical protein [Pedobacter chitinilyticus]RWU09944.1 hypothetical protein DPV69_00940 [Pedobacter chitinilyticus]
MKTLFKRTLAILMAILVLNQVFFPCVAFALTSGPNSPEASSFEPVDTTDMINPLTGDFTYGLPLLEVPGPEGGYPLSLSYHAGIQPNEDASWVGLGWSLNPGAITRNVNGYPDDFKDVTNTIRSYWSGGTTKTVGVDVGIGLGPASVNFGLSFSQDTYRGFGVGWSVGVGVGVWKSASGMVNGSVGFTVGVTPYGESYAGINGGLSFGKANEEGMKLGIGGGITMGNSISAGAGASVSYSNGKSGSKNIQASFLGLSINSGDGKVSLSVGGGASSVNSANAGRIQTESSGWSFGIPLPGISIGISSTYTRYWSDETAYVATNGVLYQPSGVSNANYFDNRAYDTYRLLNPDRTNPLISNDPDKIVGGTYPDFDSYNVSAQGLSGSMRPYIYQKTIYAQNKINNQDHNNDVVARLVASNVSESNKFAFRFINDFSNSYRQESINPTVSQFNFANAVYGNNDQNYGYDTNENRLAGSKHVQYFTNEEINSGSARNKGFVPYAGGGFNGYPNSQEYAKQIGGFMITNASGVTYHYALPVYSMHETVYTEKISRKNGHTYNDLSKSSQYAYNWLLTAITGPDYIDKNENSLLDSEDWGYWVKFNYGKWSDYYGWRNPSEGFHRDIDNDFQSYSRGFKEIYYLNNIKTRSHVAVFEKAYRADGKSVSDIPYYLNNGGIPSDNAGTVSSLKLNKIYLMKIEDYDAMRYHPDYGNLPEEWGSWLTSLGGQHDIQQGYTSALHRYSTVLDDKDTAVPAIANTLKTKSIRTIKFNYDYSLAQGTYNSYDPNFDRYAAQPVDTKSYPRLGKLTLLSVETLGLNETAISPPIEFEYDLDPNQPENKDYIQFVNGTAGPGIQTSVANKFSKGDILKFKIGSVDHYCVLMAELGNYYPVRYIQGGHPNYPGLVEAVRTKNPPYHKDRYDIWGMYKSDYIGVSSNENINRVTTSTSNRSTDVWSLRKIKTSLGAEININYEGDSYRGSVLNKNKSFILSNPQKNGLNYTFDVEYPEGNLADIFSMGSKVDFLLLRRTQYVNIWPPQNYMRNSYETIDSKAYAPAEVVSVLNNKITIKINAALDAKVQEQKPFEVSVIATGNLLARDVDKLYGGGVRVKNLEINSMDGYVKRTKYNYDLPTIGQTSSISSGVTPYEPIMFDADNAAQVINSGEVISGQTKEGYINAYRTALYKEMHYLVHFARELPSAGVMYEYITVQDEVQAPDGTLSQVAGKTMYQYEVFKANMLGKKEYGFENVNNTRVLNMGIKDYTNRVGNLKRMVAYDDKGNKLTEVINHYLHDPIADMSFAKQSYEYDFYLGNYDQQGVIQERYGDARTVFEGGTPIYRTVMSSREHYPSIMTGTTQIDYKNGTSIKQENLAFDFYNGQITKTLTSDSYGNKFMNEVVPAYRKYAAMGLKVNESTNGSRKHMLSQEASNTTYKVNEQKQKIGIIAASVQTWGTDVPVLDPSGDPTSFGQSEIWRKKANYAWMPNGATASNVTGINDFQEFSFNGSNTASWKKTSEVKLYNVYSNALEATDINNIASSSKMGYKNTKITLSGGPAKYDEIVHANAEDAFQKNGVSYFPGNIKLENGTVTTSTAHTGNKSVSIGQGQKTFVYTVPVAKLDQTRNYVASVWVKPSSGAPEGKLYYQVNEGTEYANTPTYQKQAGGWYLLEMTIPKTALTNGNLKVGVKNMATTASYVDDFRFQPLDAGTTAYVYDHHTGELTHVLDNNNLFIKYEYDATGRLVKVYKEVLGKSNIPLIKEYSYNYGKFNRTTTPHPSNEVYARLEPYYFFNYNNEYADFYVKFYSDANCTQPLNIANNLMVNFKTTTTTIAGVSVQSYDTYGSANAISGNNHVLLNTYATSECYEGPGGGGISWRVPENEIPIPGEWICTSRMVTLMPGAGYVIVY